MDFFKQVKEKITTNVGVAIKKAQDDGVLPQAEKYAFTVEIPKDASFGDFATNAAMARIPCAVGLPRAGSTAGLESSMAIVFCAYSAP